MWQHSLPDFYVPFQIHLVLSLGNAPVNFVLPCSDKSCRRKCHITAVFPPSCLCSICRFLWQFFKTKLLWDAVILHIDDVTWLTKPRLQKHCIDQIQVWELFPRYRMVRINHRILLLNLFICFRCRRQTLLHSCTEMREERHRSAPSVLWSS